jgi:hypothetical protein
MDDQVSPCGCRRSGDLRERPAGRIVARLERAVGNLVPAAGVADDDDALR